MIYAIHRETKTHIVYRQDGSQPEIVGSADWKLVEADADGWIPWDSKPGAECPLSESAKCDAWVWKGSAGEAMIVSGYRAADLLREHGARNIITYRPILDAEPSEPRRLRVGQMVEVHNDPGYRIVYGKELLGQDAEIRALFKSGDIAMAAVEFYGECFCFRTDMLRPIRTPAEEEAVEEMLEITTAMHISDMKEAMQALYRAGYRKEA